jgi:hypothetical protein
MNQKDAEKVAEQTKKISVSQLPLNEALVVLDQQAHDHLAKVESDSKHLAEEFDRTHKCIPKSSDDKKKFNAICFIYMTWVAERSRAYNRDKFPKGKAVENDEATKHYYTCMQDQILYVVQKQDIFQKQFLAMQIALRLRENILNQTKSIKNPNYKNYKKLVFKLAGSLLSCPATKKETYPEKTYVEKAKEMADEILSDAKKSCPAIQGIEKILSEEGKDDNKG